MGARRQRVEHQQRQSKPDARELYKRGREAGLNKTVGIDTEFPDNPADGWVGVVFVDGIIVLRGYKDGKTSEITGTEV